MTHKEATALAAESHCLVCHATPCEPCHWPRHRGSGGRFENDWDQSVWVPLCRVCHDIVDGRNGTSAKAREGTKIANYVVKVRAHDWQRAHQ
jgi:hypothetical protein